MTAQAEGRAWPTLLLYLAAVFVCVKFAALGALVVEGSGAAPLLALVPALWLDVLLWAVLYWTTRPLRRGRVLWFTIPLAVAAALFCAGSWGSFFTTQTWLSWQRLRGDEHVTLGDLGQLGANYAVPLVGLMLLVVVLLFPALVLTKRRGTVAALARPRTGLVALAVAALLFLVDLGTARFGFYGLSEQPLVSFALSTTREADDKSTAPLDDKVWKKLHRATAAYDAGAAPPRAKDPRNLVLFLAEGIPAKHTSFGGRVDTTPHVMRRYQDHGLWFDRFFTHTHRSIHAIFSVACSEYPPPRLDAITALHPRINCGSMMESLDQVEGMKLGLFHGGRFSFSNKLAFLGGRGFDLTLDAEDLSDPKWEGTWWGIDDRAVVDAALEFVDSVPEDERFFLLLIPISPHEPYDIPKSSGVPKRIKGDTPKRRKFLRAVQFSDVVFERLMKGLEERGRYDDTLTVWAPDHGNQVDEPPRPTLGKRMLYQQNVHVPLVFLHPGSFSGQRSHRLGAQIDLSPTLTAAMGAPPDPRDRGVDLLAPRLDPRRIFLLKSRGADPFVGIVDGDYKFTYDIKAARAELYDLEADPEERSNLAAANAPRVRGYTRDALRFRAAQRETILEVPALEEEQNARAMMEAATLRCAPEGPCDGVSKRVTQCKGSWVKADCIELKAPAATRLELSFPGEMVGRYDSLRVRWWNRDRKKIPKVKLSLRYGDRTIAMSKPRSRSDKHRVLPVPHRALEGRPPIVLVIESPLGHDPMVEFAEH